MGVYGAVNLTVIFQPAEHVSSRNLPKCFFMRYPQGCEDYHELRAMWLAANDYLDDFYEPHHDLVEQFRKRWMHSLRAEVPAEATKLHVQEYYSFINPVHES